MSLALSGSCPRNRLPATYLFATVCSGDFPSPWTLSVLPRSWAIRRCEVSSSFTAAAELLWTLPTVRWTRVGCTSQFPSRSLLGSRESPSPKRRTWGGRYCGGDQTRTILRGLGALGSPPTGCDELRERSGTRPSVLPRISFFAARNPATPLGVSTGRPATERRRTKQSETVWISRPSPKNDPTCGGGGSGGAKV